MSISIQWTVSFFKIKHNILVANIVKINIPLQQFSIRWLKQTILFIYEIGFKFKRTNPMSKLLYIRRLRKHIHTHTQKPSL